jgi:hydrogenase-4 component F
MRLAFILVALGHGTAGLAPMHTWKPDAYAEAPVPSAALLGAGFINCALYSIIRFDVLRKKALGTISQAGS